jgi:hypothetical protein
MLTLEDWSTGEILVEPFVQGPQARIKLVSPSRPYNSVCTLSEICFCGAATCEMPGWTPTKAALSLPEEDGGSRRALGAVTSDADLTQADDGEARRGLSAAATSRDPMTVTIVFGLIANDGSPLLGDSSDSWRFDPQFEPENPWAQRALLAMCSDLPKEMKVYDADCWPIKFRNWLQKRALPFPTRDFNKYLDIFLQDGDEALAGFSVWMRKGRLVATKLEFKTQFDVDMPSVGVPEVKQHWDKFV